MDLEEFIQKLKAEIENFDFGSEAFCQDIPKDINEIIDNVRRSK